MLYKIEVVMTLNVGLQQIVDLGLVGDTGASTYQLAHLKQAHPV